MPTYPDYNAIPGFHGANGVPDDVLPETHLWSVHVVDTAFFGVQMIVEDGRSHGADLGFCRPLSTHRMRALELYGFEETDPQPSFDSGWDPNLVGPLDGDHPVEREIPDCPTAAGDILLEVKAKGDFEASTEYCEVFVNGAAVGQILKDAYPYPAISSDELSIPANIWNQVLPADGKMTIRVVPTSAVGATSGSGIKMRVTYAQADEIVYTLAMQELCLQHRGWGFRLRPDGFVEMVTFTQPDRTDEVELNVGGVYVCPADHPPGLGEPGWCVFAVPHRLPWAVEGIVASHPVFCGVPI